MSGLAGVFRLAGPPDLTPLPRMSRVMDARGPDQRAEVGVGAGAFGVTARAPGDPGDNPAWDPSGRWCVATDGELLNRRPLLAELTAWGHAPLVPNTPGIAACIFAENGFEAGLARLAGDVAILAWDGKDQRLWAARDRAGLRPVHFAELADGTLLVTSEPNAVVVHPGVDRRPDADALDELLSLGTVLPPRTPWRGVRKLAPGELLSLSRTGMETRRWWTDAANPPGTGGARYRWARSVQFSVELAIQQRVAGDNVLAVATSGGVYAEALLASTAARRRRSVLAVTVGFEAGDARAAEVARRCGAEHVQVPLATRDVPELLDEVAAIGEPILDPAALGWWAVSRVAWERGADTLMTGVGGAELFGGPAKYFSERTASVPGAALLGRAARAAGVERLGGLAAPWVERHLGRAGLEATASVQTLATQAPSADPTAAALWLDRRLLAEGGLATVDRAAGAHGLRAQAPYADANLAKMVASIPIAHLVQVRRHRGLFLDAMAERLQGDVASAPMAPPVEAWLADGELLRGVDEALEGIVPGDRVRALLSLPPSSGGGLGRGEARRWALVALAAWRRKNGV